MRVSPYSHPTHNIAASSMHDLGNMSHIRGDSKLRPAYSEANLRTNFANASMTSLPVPGTHRDRPATPGGSNRTKPWVNPLDVHFNRPTPTPPRSPTMKVDPGQNYTEQKPADTHSSPSRSKPDEAALPAKTSVDQKERPKKESESIGKVEMEGEVRQHRQKQQDEGEKLEREQRVREGKYPVGQQEHGKERSAAAAAAAIRSPAQGPPLGQAQVQPFPSRRENTIASANRPHHQRQPGQRLGSPVKGNNYNLGIVARPVFQGPTDSRPGSRNGYGYDQMDRPGSSRDPRERLMPPGRPAQSSGQHGRHGQPLFQWQTNQRPSRRNDHNGLGHGLVHHRSQNSPGLIRAGEPEPRTLPTNAPYDKRLQPAPLISNANGRPGTGHSAQDSGNPCDPTSLPSPPVSLPPSGDDRCEQEDIAPIIRDVQARRDTLTMDTSRRTSLSMTIEAFERSMIEAQGDGLSIRGSGSRRGSDASSQYSVDARPGPPSYPLPPVPHGRPSPPHGVRSSPSPTRRMPGRGVQRPSRDEYDVAPASKTSPESRSRSRETGTVTYDYLRRMTRPNPLTDFDSPPRVPPGHLDASIEPAPLFLPMKWNKEPRNDPFTGGDFSDPRPAPTPSPKPGLVFHFPGPPTPESTHNWPLPSPTPSTTPQLKRSNLPPPLDFDFSSSGYSRSRTGPYTPPVRIPRSPGLLEEPRPHTSAGLGIGVARGPSMREPGNGHAYGMDRRPGFGLTTSTGIADDFGTPLI